MNTFVPMIILFTGFVLLGLGVLVFFRQRANIAQSLPAEGVVTKLIRKRKQGKFVVSRTEAGTKIEEKYHYRPQVRFTTEAGRTVEFIASISARPARYQVGERVQVLYNPHKSDRAQINRFLELWFHTLMLIFFGVFSIGMGILGLLLAAL